MLTLLFLSWGLLISAELLKLDFTSITTFNNPAIERRDLLRPLINELARQVSFAYHWKILANSVLFILLNCLDNTSDM